VKLGGTNAQAL